MSFRFWLRVFNTVGSCTVLFAVVAGIFVVRRDISWDFWGIGVGAGLGICGLIALGLWNKDMYG